MANGYIADGTAEATTGSKTVTFMGVSVALFGLGNPFFQGGAPGVIAAIDLDANTVTLEENWFGASTPGGAAYSVVTLPASTELAEQSRRWLQYFKGPILSIATMYGDAAPGDGDFLSWDDAGQGWEAKTPADVLTALLAGRSTGTGTTVVLSDAPRLTKLGIGMDAVNLLDMTQNQNGTSSAFLLNNDSGGTARGRYVVSNGGSSAQLIHNGITYTPNGLNRADGSLLLGTGAGGVTINASGGTIYMAPNGAETAQFTTIGALAMTGSGTDAPCLGTVNNKFRITTSGNPGYSYSLIDNTNGFSGLSCKRIFINNQADETPGGTPQVLINGNGYSAVHWLDSDAYYIYQNSAARSLRISSGPSLIGVQLSAGAISWSTFSQLEVKTDFEEITGAIGIINAHRLESWLYKVDDPTRQRRVGPYYEDAAAHWPYAASMGPDGKGTVSVADYVPLTMRAIQELDARDADFESRIAALEAAH